jgi:hypothetical protein
LSVIWLNNFPLTTTPPLPPQSHYYPFQNLRPTNHPTTISQKQNWWGAACSLEKPSLHKIWLLLRFDLSSSYQNSQHQN